MISDRGLKASAYLAHQEIERHRRDNQPPPLWLLEAQRELSCELAARGHETTAVAPEPAKLETVAERARRTGRSKRTERRYAKANGAVLINGAWIYERQ